MYLPAGCASRVQGATISGRYLLYVLYCTGRTSTTRLLLRWLSVLVSSESSSTWLLLGTVLSFPSPAASISKRPDID